MQKMVVLDGCNIRGRLKGTSGSIANLSLSACRPSVPDKDIVRCIIVVPSIADYEA